MRTPCAVLSPAFAPAACVAPVPAHAEAAGRALLIRIDQYRELPDLGGAVTGVQLMRQVARRGIVVVPDESGGVSEGRSEAPSPGAAADWAVASVMIEVAP